MPRLISGSFAIGGTILLAGTALHPHEHVNGGTLQEQFHAMFSDPHWYPAHLLLLVGLALITVAVVGLARTTSPSLPVRMTRFAAIASAVATAAMVLHVLAKLDDAHTGRGDGTLHLHVHATVRPGQPGRGVGDGRRCDATAPGTPRSGSSNGRQVTLQSATMRDVSWSPRNRIGLALAFLLGLIGVPMVLRGAPAPGVVGPPAVVLVTESLCGVVTVVVTIGWRRASSRAIRLAAGAQIVSVLTALPAFFLDRPALNKLLLAILLGATLTAVVLMLTPSRRSVTA